MKHFFLCVLSLAVLATACEEPVKKPLKLSKLFSDHMVLQQNQEVPVWGEYSPGQKVSVEGSWGVQASAVSDSIGKWNVLLRTPEAGGPFTVSINTPDSTIVINDVLSGEVWLASGQSNMEMPLKGWPPNDLIEHSAEEIAAADNPQIRMFTVTNTISLSPLDSVRGDWQVSSPETTGDFSATAYFFAKRLQSELKVPVGIIHSSWGGTVAEAWTSEPNLRKLEDFNQSLDLIKDPATFKKVEDWFGRYPTEEIPKTEEAWQQIEFGDIEASKEDYDDSGWEVVQIPGAIDMMPNGSFDGAVWVRKEFELSDVSSDYTLKLGAIDDMDATYVNGQKVGGLAGEGYWNVPREMVIPASLLRKGKNTIAIRIIDTTGGGSVGGPVELVNKKGESISLKGDWKRAVIAEIYLDKFHIYGLEHKIEDRPNFLQLNPNLPSVLYNGMINPLVPYAIKGAIWYQGESNVGRDEQYRRLFPAMITDWREQWQEQFPFYFVQIAPYRYTTDPSMQVSQKLREAQRVSLKTPKTGMVVTLDIGNPTNIHPGNKHDVGWRLAGLALDNDYDRELVSSGPLFKGQSRSDDSLVMEMDRTEPSLILKFDHVGSGLMAGDSGLTEFEIAGADGVFVPAKATISGKTVLVTAKGIDEPQFVRYAWKDDSSASLFNEEGLPASSFSSED